MSHSKANRRKDENDQRSRSELPDWVSEDLIRKTVKIWQPYYLNGLTRDDAIAIIKNVGVLFECLRREK